MVNSLRDLVRTAEVKLDAIIILPGTIPNQGGSNELDLRPMSAHATRVVYQEPLNYVSHMRGPGRELEHYIQYLDCRSMTEVFHLDGSSFG